MTDHEIHLALARFMGWTEMPSSPYMPILGGSFVQSESTGCEAMIWRGLAPVSPHEPWSPTTNPAQAVEVMAEVARKGGRVETICREGSPPYSLAYVYMQKPYDYDSAPGSAAEQHEDPAASWCRAVCVATAKAIKAHEKASLPGDPFENTERDEETSDRAEP